MKKYLVITLTCVVASLLILGSFNALQSSSENSEQLKEAWEKAEAAIETANGEMDTLDMKLVKYQTEHKTIKATGVSLASTMWNPLDIAKGLFTNAHPMVKLLELEANIAFVYGQMYELNGILKERETARDNALTAYNNSTSQKQTKKQTPKYREIPELSIPCQNYCGTKFSSADVGYDNLGYAAEWTHKTTCDVSGTPNGCGDSYYTCNGKQNGIEEAKKHKVIYCGKDVRAPRDRNSNKLRGPVVGICGAPYRTCANTRGEHGYTYFYKSNPPGGNGWYANRYQAFGWGLSKHDNGSEKAHAVSIHGPNGLGIDRFADKTPNCSTCVDGSSYCPNARSHSNNNHQAQNTVTTVQEDNSPNCDYCTGTCSACTQPTTPTTTKISYHACGVCERSVPGDHSLQSSCSISNNWMRTCTVTNFYACQPHTCVFPTFSCGRKTCTQKVADPQEHRKISIDGVKYWSCNPSAVEAHMTRYCTKLKVKVKWNKKLNRKEGVWEICGEAFTRHNQQSCMDAYRRVRYHKE